MCCKAMNAQCMACENRMTVEDFCLIRGNEHIQGCERKDIIISKFLANSHIIHSITNTKRNVAHFNSLKAKLAVEVFVTMEKTVVCLATVMAK